MKATDGSQAGVAEVEVLAKATRRRFTAKYKKRILDEVEACTRSGEIGALLRREGLYSSLLAKWRIARERGGVAALTDDKRGPKGKAHDGSAKRVAQLERELVRTRARAERAEALVELQRKMSELLGIQLATENGESR